MSTPQPPAGWYPDQVNPQLVRWWDGRMWTHHVQPVQQPPAPQQPVQQQPQQAAAGGGPGVGPMFADQQLQVIQDARAWGIFEKAAYQVIGQGGQPIGSIQQVQAQPEQGRWSTSRCSTRAAPWCSGSAGRWR